MNRELRLSGKQKIDRRLCLKNYAMVDAQGCTSKVDKKQKSECWEEMQHRSAA